MHIKSHPDYVLRQTDDRIDEKLMHSAALFLLKISKAAENFIVTDTKS